MGNICTIKSRCKLKYDQVTTDLHEINRRRFNNLLEIQEVVEFDCWNICFNGQVGFTIHKSPRYKGRLTLKHGRHWWMWVDVVVTNELALKYNGSITDEGVSGSWKGTAGKYPTIHSWFEAIAADVMPVAQPSAKAAIKQMLDLDLSLVPDPIKGIDNATKEEG
jgi:hypothetical protein